MAARRVGRRMMSVGFDVQPMSPRGHPVKGCMGGIFQVSSYQRQQVNGYIKRGGVIYYPTERVWCPLLWEAPPTGMFTAFIWWHADEKRHRLITAAAQHARARTHTRANARTYVRTHTHTHARTYTLIFNGDETFLRCTELACHCSFQWRLWNDITPVPRRQVFCAVLQKYVFVPHLYCMVKNKQTDLHFCSMRQAPRTIGYKQCTILDENWPGKHEWMVIWFIWHCHILSKYYSLLSLQFQLSIKTTTKSPCSSTRQKTKHHLRIGCIFSFSRIVVMAQWRLNYIKYAWVLSVTVCMSTQCKCSNHCCPLLCLILTANLMEVKAK